jgi:hypothetical protein
MGLDGSGGLYVAGSFTTYTGATNNRIIKLNANTAAKDTTFVNTTGFNSGQVNQIRVSGSTILCVGSFTQWKGVSQTRIVRLDNLGNADATFITGTGFNGAPIDARYDNLGRIIAIGVFTGYSGITANRLARLENNGNFDQTFTTNNNSAFNIAYTSPGGSGQVVEFDSSNNIYLCGGFNSFGGVALNNLIKLNSSGTNITFNSCMYPGVTPTPSATEIVTDPNAQTYVTTLIANGALFLTNSRKIAINNLFIDLKNAGLYYKIYALYPMLGGVYQSIRWNAVLPGDSDAEFRLTQQGVVNISNLGVSGFLANTAYLNTFFNPTAQSIPNDNFSMFSFVTVSGTSGYELGGASLNAWNGLGSNVSGNFYAEIQRTALTNLTTGGGLGFQAVSRIDNTNQIYVKDGGAATTTAIARTGGIPNVNLFIGAYNGVGQYSNKTLGTTGLAQGLTDVELADLRDIITTFETAYAR